MMTEYHVEVWATVSGQTAKEIVSFESETEPTDDEIHNIYQEYIGNILDSGAYLVKKGDSDEQLD